ncbi:MAG: asparaginase [Candidatus Neomarinimicrobiota bacterium]|tara:strand:+ start:1313 stop:2287 length:975 start_codon:yes stop_codon:yes gene_type:complete
MAILCRVTRGELTESIHVAFAVAVDESGNLVYSTGDPNYLTCIRSCLKPFQAAAIIKSGAVDNFTSEELALMCSSHQGEEFHIKLANSMLDKLGFNDTDYECGIHYPFNEKISRALVQSDKKLTSLYNNCSGKHAGMLALSKYLSVDKKGYIDKNHPVQKYILKYIKTLNVAESLPIEIDGCSVPTPFMTLESIAKLYQLLASSKEKELGKVFDIMCEFPKVIGGTNNFDSMFIDALQGRGITKIGGESVRGIALRKKNGGSIGVAIKILDGNTRAMPAATINLLKHLNLLKSSELTKLDQFKFKTLKNHNGYNVGKIETIIED